MIEQFGNIQEKVINFKFDYKYKKASNIHWYI